MSSNPESTWPSLSPKEAALNYINHVYEHYCKDYNKGSNRYEWIYNILNILIILLGFISAVLAALLDKNPVVGDSTVIRVLIIIFPLLSSTFATLLSQNRIKERYQLRENARIRANYYYTVARIRFATAKTDEEFSDIHKWLAERIYRLQIEQASGFFGKGEDNNLERPFISSTHK